MRMPVRILFSDGRLVCSMELERGESFIYLDAGVCFWTTGEWSGRVVVR